MKRIILDVPDKLMARIDAQKEDLGIKSRTELIRHALFTFIFIEEQKKLGYQIHFEKEV